MIPRANITAWRTVAPWPSNEQVEQDLVLSRALVAMYGEKGRDLYDLWLALGTGKPNPDRVVECFQRYMDHDGAVVSRAEFEANLAAKLASATFLEDLRLLVPPEAEYDPVKAAEVVKDELIAKLPGELWKGSAP